MTSIAHGSRRGSASKNARSIGAACSNLSAPTAEQSPVSRRKESRKYCAMRSRDEQAAPEGERGRGGSLGRRRRDAFGSCSAREGGMKKQCCGKGDKLRGAQRDGRAVQSLQGSRGRCCTRRRHESPSSQGRHCSPLRYKLLAE
jgi:hypothetical protein